MIIVRDGIKGALWFSIYKGKSCLAILKPDEMLEMVTEIWDNMFTACLRWTEYDCANFYTVSLTPNSEGINDLTLHIDVSGMGGYKAKVPICQLEPSFREAVRGFTLQPFDENEVLGYLINNDLIKPVDIFSIHEFNMKGYRAMVDCCSTKYPESYGVKHCIPDHVRIREIFDFYDSRKD